jgi:hypothetical protein
MQQTLIAVQTALPMADVPIGTATIMFAQTVSYLWIALISSQQS